MRGNSLGQGIPANRRVANLPVIIADTENPRNENSVRNSFVPPKHRRLPIPNSHYNTYRDTMNNTDWALDYKNLLRGQRVTQVAYTRKRNVVIPGRDFTPVAPNLRNRSADVRGMVIVK